MTELEETNPAYDASPPPPDSLTAAEASAQQEEAIASAPPVEDAPLVDFSRVRERAQGVIDAGDAHAALQFLETFSRWPDTTRHLSDNVWLHGQIGALASQAGQPQAALEAYERAFSLDPRQRTILEPLAGLLIGAGEHERALRVVQALLLYHKHALKPDALVALYLQLGACYEALEQRARARSAYEKALDQRAQDPGAMAGLLRVAAAEGDPHEGIRVRQRQLRVLTDPEARASALVGLGDDWQEQFQDTGRAMDAYEQALTEHPTHAPALQRIAQLSATQGDWRSVSRAYFTLSRISEVPEEEADWLIKASQIARDELWEPEKALAGYRRAVELDPTRLDAFKIVTTILIEAGDWGALQNAYAQLIQANSKMEAPDQSLLIVLWQKLGELYRTHLELPREALVAYDQASKLNPHDIALHEQVIELAERDAEHYDLGLAHLRAIQQLEPQRPGLLDRVGRMYLRKKDADRAFMIFRALAYRKEPLDDKARQFVERFSRPIYKPLRRPLTPDLLKRHVFSATLDRRISTIFALLKPALEEWVGESQRHHGLGRKNKVKLEDPLAFNNIYRSVGQLLTYERLPELWRKSEQPGLINGALIPEGLIVGDQLMGSGREKHIAFVVGKQLFMFLAPFYLAAIRPLNHLQVFFRLALHFADPQRYPMQLTGDGADIVKEYKKRIRGAEFQQLQQAVAAISASGTEPDIATWIEAVEDTANRVGLIFCDDLSACEDYLRDEPQRISQRSVEQRMASLVEYALCDEYADLRDVLGLSVAGG